MRANFPEYFRWQDAMRPEDSGAQDGRRAATGAEDQARQFELKVAHHLQSLVGVVRNNFAEEEHAMWAGYRVAKSRFATLRAGWDELARSAQAPIVARRASVGRGLAIGLVLALGLALTGLIAFLLGQVGFEGGSLALLSIGVGAGLVAASYTCGVVLRQSRQQWHWMACLAVAAIAATVLLWAFVSWPADSLAPAARWLLGVGALLCGTAIGFVANRAHDPDPHASRLERELAEAFSAYVQLVARRNENSAFHLNVAQRHRELAGQMVSIYRQAFRHAATDGLPTPPAFEHDAAFEEVDAAWFAIHEENTP